MCGYKMMKEYKEEYRKLLLENVIPFWMKYSIDTETGCINNCMDDTGKVLSRNRYLWSQGRALWTFSALYNRIENKKEWLETAEGLFSYLSAHGRDDGGKWMFLLDGSGNILEYDTSIYVDAFVMNGMCEFYKASGNKKAAAVALETCENTLARIREPGSYRISPYSIPNGMKTHGINMIFSYFYYELGKTLNRKDICDIGYNLALEILKDFYNFEKDAVLEFVNLDGSRTDTPEERVCVPGHVLESMWFLIRIFEHAGDNAPADKCCRMIKRHLELGWDDTYGGILLALDIDGKKPVAWNRNECKPWWAHVEALVATTAAWKHTGEDWALEWHRKVHDYAFAHYPSPYGEWVQWLDRAGNKAESAALPVKDPFHLPRGLIELINLI